MEPFIENLNTEEPEAQNVINLSFDRRKELVSKRCEYMALLKKLNKTNPLYNYLYSSFPRKVDDYILLKYAKKEEETANEKTVFKRAILQKYYSDLHIWEKENLQVLKDALSRQELCEDLIELEVDLFFPD